QAMAKGAPRLHADAPDNVEHRNQIKAGDPDAIFGKARRVVKQRMVSQRLCGVPLEPRAALAVPDPATGGLTFWATNQAPHSLRNDLATALGLPQNMVRVIAPEVVRRRNFIPPSAFPYKAPTGQNYDSGEYDRALTKALELAGVAKLRAEQKERRERKDRHLLGVGMACYVEMCGFGPFESAVV